MKIDGNYTLLQVLGDRLALYAAALCESEEQPNEKQWTRLEALVFDYLKISSNHKETP